MIIPNHKAIFMHIGKTGGTSIETFFGRNFEYPQSEKRCFGCKHWRPAKLEEKWPTQWKEYYKFSFVRNPWDRLVSMFFFRRNRRKIIKSSTEFEEFARNFINKKPNWKQIAWFEGRLDDFDFIGRFENLQEDFEYVCEQIGAETKILPHALKTEHEHYTSYYDDELRELVGEAFQEDLDTFGYEFE